MPKRPQNSIYQWDSYSDQPAVISDKAAKRRLYIVGALGSFKTLLTSLLLPGAAVLVALSPRFKSGQTIDNIGLCVNIDTPVIGKTSIQSGHLVEMVEELGVRDLLIRLPLSDLENLDRYVDFAANFKNKRILINILQDRMHIEDPKLLKNSLRQIFTSLHSIVEAFQIGNSINRRKWAFTSIDEYFRFFSVAQQLRDKEFPELKLFGGNIIDFELPNFVRSVFHNHKIKYDGVAAQLYVDRRGAPENTQLGCDLVGKINWFHVLTRISRKTGNELRITETNWPLKDTEPFAPAVGDCMVNEDTQATYLVRYYLLAIASGKISKCYWHQLVAPGYGLVDNRGSDIRKRRAFYSFKILNKLFSGGKVLGYSEDQNGLCQLSVENANGVVVARWVNGSSIKSNVGSSVCVIDLVGNTLTPDSDRSITISDHVVYLLDYPYA